MSTGTSSTSWLTQDAYDRLSAELQKLIANRPVMAQEINARREEGDLKENGGYHAAREEQGKQEGRILQLTQLLREAKVGEAPTSEGTAGPGMVVTVRFGGADSAGSDDDEVETFLIGSREEAGTTDLDVYSSASPLGQALTGAKEGDVVSYSTPTGKTLTVTLLTAKPYRG
ncbi:MAG: transcription elongation factor GreA [Jatrophihabitantaceae bacterium]